MLLKYYYKIIIYTIDFIRYVEGVKINKILYIYKKINSTFLNNI
jgi:hypothetical protein